MSMSVLKYRLQHPGAYEVAYPQIPPHFDPANEDKLNLLQQYDTVFLVDDSLSMMTVDGPKLKSRWTTAVTWLAILAEIAARYDNDGIDIHFLNSRVTGKGLRTRSDVEHIFRSVEPSGTTPTKTRIGAILADYLKPLDKGFFNLKRRTHVKPLNFVVITDGVPHPASEDPREAIQTCMRKLDSLSIPKDYRQVGVMFVQVGMDMEATEHLIELDNMQQDRDIVDTFKSNMSDVRQWTSEDWNFKVVKLLLGGIDKRTDEMNVKPKAAPSPLACGQKQFGAPDLAGPWSGYGPKQPTQDAPPTYNSGMI